MNGHHERIRFCAICGARLVERFDDFIRRRCTACDRAGTRR